MNKNNTSHLITVSKFTLLFFLITIAFATVMIDSCDVSSKNDGSSENTASDSQLEIIPVDVSLSDTQLEIGINTIRTISAEGGQEITWRSSDESIASVNPDGLITGIGKGECDLTAVNEFDRSAQCHVTVKKTVFITIDDGPLGYCGAILKKLKRHDVKATFFVVKTSNIAMTEQMHKDGHYVGLHTYSHNFAKCYRNEYSYFTDLEKLKDIVEQYTGERTNIIRFPGGTSNHAIQRLSMRRMVTGLDDLGYREFDWTISSGDATNKPITHESVAYRVISNCFNDFEIVLMHDKATTPKALDIIIPVLKERGYIFETLDHCAEYSHRDPSWYEKSVTDEIVPCETLTVDNESYQLSPDKSFTLKATMVPDNTTDYVRFVSDNPSVASVTLEGIVTGIRPGTAKISAIASSGKEAVCTVAVSELPAATDAN